MSRPHREQPSVERVDAHLQAYGGPYRWGVLRAHSTEHLTNLVARAERTLAEWLLQVELAQNARARMPSRRTCTPQQLARRETLTRLVRKSALHAQIQQLRLDRLRALLDQRTS